MQGEITVSVRDHTAHWQQQYRAPIRIYNSIVTPEERPMTPASADVKRKTGDGSKAAAARPLTADELRKMDAYWRASNYLSVGQIYLLDNPLLKEPLKREHIKPRLLGHWGTSPGLNMICVHLNRVIKRDNLNMIYIIGPGHGRPALVTHG